VKACRETSYAVAREIGARESPALAIGLGAATFDRGGGVSRYTGEVMHHIDPNVDTERSKLVADLVATGRVARLETLPGRAVTASANGGGTIIGRTDGSWWRC